MRNTGSPSFTVTLQDGLSLLRGGPTPASGGKNSRAFSREALPVAGGFPASLALFHIAHTSAGRLRLRPYDRKSVVNRLPEMESGLIAGLRALFVKAEITVSPVTGSVLILYTEARVRRDLLLPADDGAGQRDAGETVVRNPIPGKIRSFFYPRFFISAIAVFRAIPYIFSALRQLLLGKLGLDVLDGAALLVCLLQRDFRSLSSITFFFALGEFLADWTRRKSRASLEKSLALKIDRVWIREGELERQIPFAELKKGHHVVVRAGYALPVDGTVVEGQGMVNQASMTGESLPAHKKAGATVFAGTVLEEGELCVLAARVGSDTRINAILRAIEESEQAKAVIQGKYEHMADSIVPYNFLLSAAVLAVTGNAARAGSVLLVDYSCAIRLATPLAIFTAMKDAADRGILIKGGKYMEAISEADVVVFDKTGTLTKAKPVLVDVIPFGQRTRQDVLRLAACLEEHFAHPVGQAVVRASDAEGLKHREEHAKVEYILAHGIASIWRDQFVRIGSGHFVLDDEGISLTAAQKEIVARESAEGRSLLYLSVGSELAGLLMIEDDIRSETPGIVRALRDDGVSRVIMLTGDSEPTAAGIARKAGITEYRSQMLPEDKAVFIKQLKRQGARVAMIGDGINDSPALAEADVGIAMAGGADMAREVADVVLVNERLEGILLARTISRMALARVRRSFLWSLGLNSVFLVGGLLGFFRPGMSALLHNASTAAIAVSSVQPLELGAGEPESGDAGV